MPRRLQLRFDTLAAFRGELEHNIVCGGAFIGTTEGYEPRELVEVEIDLPFCGQSVVLGAEVVNQIGADVTGIGGLPGVAVQFADSAPMLRQMLAGMAGIDAPPLELGKRRTRPEAPVRYEPRSTVRLPVVVETSSERQAAHTVNMSLSGALIELDGPTVPLSEEIVITLPQPEMREALQVAGRVVRHVVSADERNQIGVHFDLDPSEETPLRRMLERVLKAAHSRNLGRVVGELRVLGMGNLLQMLAASSEQGTLLVRRGDNRARVLFDGGALRYVSVGAVSGEKALARLIDWTEGEFEFTPSIDVGAPEGSRMSLDAALLQVVQHADELRRLDLSQFPSAAQVLRGGQDQVWHELDKLSNRVLEAVSEGIVMGELLDSLSEFDDEIYRALAVLLELGLIRIQGPAGG